MVHIKILGTIFNLIIGTWAAVYAYHMFRTYAYPFLRPLIHHIVFYNILILFTLVSRYLDTNLPDDFTINRLSLYDDIGFIFIYLAVVGMTYAMIRIILGFRDKVIPAKWNKGIIFGTAILTIGILGIMIFPEKSPIHNWLYLFYDNVGAVFFAIEIAFFISLFVYAKKTGDRKKAKLCNSFGMIYLSRYIIVPIMIMLPMEIRFFASMGGLILFNFFPLIWFKFFFLKYAQSMLSLLEDNTSLETIYKKYTISKREQEVLRLLVDGRSNKEIEEELYISIHTVKNHVYSLYRKLGVKTRHQLVHFITRFQHASGGPPF